MDAHKELQPKNNGVNSCRRAAGAVGFAFSTKDRVEYSQQSIASLDTCGGFDVVWVDGSDTPEGKALPESVKPRNCRIVEVHHDVRAGPDAAICFGLRRLLQLGYDYCGLIENDIRFEPGWFPKLMELFEIGAQDNLKVGSATVLCFESRVIAHQPHYVTNWNMGAAMVLFTREAAQIILASYGAESARGIANFYRKKFDIDILDRWELMMAGPDHLHGCDWMYAPNLYKHGLWSLGTVPSLALAMDLDVAEAFRSSYVTSPSKPTEADAQCYARMIEVLRRRRFVAYARRLFSQAWYHVVNGILGPKMHTRSIRQAIHPYTTTRVFYRRATRRLAWLARDR